MRGAGVTGGRRTRMHDEIDPASRMMMRVHAMQGAIDCCRSIGGRVSVAARWTRRPAHTAPGRPHLVPTSRPFLLLPCGRQVKMRSRSEWPAGPPLPLAVVSGDARSTDGWAGSGVGVARPQLLTAPGVSHGNTVTFLLLA